MKTKLKSVRSFFSIRIGQYELVLWKIIPEAPLEAEEVSLSERREEEER